MKQLNTMQFVTNAVERLTELRMQLGQAETYEGARNVANGIQGYLDCLNTFRESMESDDLALGLNDLIRDWHIKTVQALINKAERMGQEKVLEELFAKRDKYKKDAEPESESRISDNMEKIITAASGDSDMENSQIRELFGKINKAEVTKSEEEAEIRMWADWAAMTNKITDGLSYKGIHGVSIEPLSTKCVMIHNNIYKLAHILCTKVKESYNPNREYFPFKCEFQYRGITFEQLSSEHITCPDEYRDTIYTSTDDEKAEERQQENEES